jgi:hypothetical protein
MMQVKEEERELLRGFRKIVRREQGVSEPHNDSQILKSL